jgi:2Fe-2S ferredoxin
MARIKYIEHNGNEHIVDVQNGLTVMEGAVQNDIPGIDADCGGGMSCATCHVYVKKDWYDKLPKKELGEDDMLDQAYEPKSNSRLSCQIIVSDELDGLSVNMPEKQV